MPLMMLKKAIQALPDGAQVHIEVTDVHAELDFEIWCERFGHGLQKLQKQNATMTFIISKNADTKYSKPLTSESD